MKSRKPTSVPRLSATVAITLAHTGLIFGVRLAREHHSAVSSGSTMLASRNCHLVALVAVLVVGASLVLLPLLHCGAGLIFLALLPAIVAVLISFTCAFPLCAWQLPSFAQAARDCCGCRAPPTDLPCF